MRKSDNCNHNKKAINVSTALFSTFWDQTFLKVLFALMPVNKDLEISHLREKGVLSGTISVKQACSTWQYLSENVSFVW